MKIIINTPHIQLLGGVANHYKGLQSYWNQEVYYNYIGGRRGVPGAIIIFYDLLKFILRCFVIRPDIVVLNPSLGKTALKRDALFLKISSLLGLKTVVFFHGWKEKQARIIEKKPSLFLKKYNKADAFLVLASEFKKKLQHWGIQKPVYLTTTKIDDNIIRYFNGNDRTYGKKLLFLARVIKEKGIFTTLKAFKKIKEAYPQAKLTVAGSGKALDDAKNFVRDNSISDVGFTGFISGDKLVEAFTKSDIYILPTHGEGMPTSVLEAMAFGMPVISRPVGGMVDFFEEDKMGYLLESIEPDKYAEKVIKLFENKEKLERIGKYNHKYAIDNFLASKVARNLENIFKEMLN